MICIILARHGSSPEKIPGRKCRRRVSQFNAGFDRILIISEINGVCQAKGIEIEPVSGKGVCKHGFRVDGR